MIQERFDQPWGPKKDYMISPNVIGMPSVKVCRHADDIIPCIIYARKNSIELAETGMLTLDENISNQMYEEQYLEQMISDAITEDRIVVFYQPIYSVEEKRFVSAEALVRIIDENGKVTGDTSIKDEPLDDGEIVIMKTDVDTKAPLAGAKITVYDTENVVVYTGVSDKDGKFTIKGLKVGSYTFVETEAPSGYIRSRQTYKFTITEDGKVEGTTAFTNKKDGTTTTSTPGSPSGSTTLTGSPKTGNIISRV